MRPNPAVERTRRFSASTCQCLRGAPLTLHVRSHKLASSMSPIFKKLNLGSHTIVHVLNAPRSFEPELAALECVSVKRSVSGPCSFALVFVVTQAELDSASKRLSAACSGDAVLWVAYPKGSSKKYKCEFNRDSGWPALASAGYEPVRMAAIDEDWSALRFRKVEHIKSMTRTRANAISEAGKRKASGGGT